MNDLQTSNKSGFSTAAPPTTATPWITLLLLFVACSACKVLLIPSYRSTDFDVHRNWLAITRHLPLKEWYYNDVDGRTVHTLDYPPSFAAWEYLLSNNPLTNALLKTKWLDERCLALLPDNDNDPTKACVVFHRSTVIFSDLVLWWGAWVASQGAAVQQQQLSIGTMPVSFLLMVFYPGLLWLDHIHFQYNGILFGLLLASLGYLMQGNSTTNSSRDSRQQQERNFHTNHWKAAVLFALLLTMKHLFLTLAPIYFVYLLRRYCLVEYQNTNATSSKAPHNAENKNTKTRLKLEPLRLLTLGMYTATTLLVPFLPFLKQFPQLGIRLFPFGRGLVHDYWAANVWALYSLGDKVLGLVGHEGLPDVPASVCAVSVLLSLLPVLYYGAWMAAARQDNARLILTVVYAAMSSFHLGFHVHEKAVLNALIPMALIVSMSTTMSEQPTAKSIVVTPNSTRTVRVLFLQMNGLGLLGIFPLLFRAVELPVKLASYTGYMAFSYHALMELDAIDEKSQGRSSSILRMLEWLPVTTMIMGIIVIVEFLPPRVFGKLEFLPLLLTSVGCAAGLSLCWIRLFILLVKW